MELVVMIIGGIVEALLMTISVCMMLRAVLSFLPIQEDNPILLFTVMVTEPIVAPIRALFEHFGWFQNLPIDISFLVASIVISIVSVVVMSL